MNIIKTKLKQFLKWWWKMMDNQFVYDIMEIVSVRDVLNVLNVEIKNNFIVCPVHDDRRPSMFLYRKSAYCFTCHANLNIYKLVKAYKNINYIQAIEFIIDAFNLNYDIKTRSNKISTSWLEDYKTFEKEDKLFLKSLKQYYLELIKSFDTFLDIYHSAGYYNKMYAHHKPKNDIVFYELNQPNFPDGLFKNLDYLKKAENFLAKHWILPDFEEIKLKVNDGYLFSKVVNLMEDTLKNSSQ